MKKFLYSIPIGFLIIFITSYTTSTFMLSFNNDISNLVLGYFSFLPISNTNMIKDIMLAILHNCFIIYVFSSYIKDELHNNGPYIFTRTSKKEIWLIKEYIKILKYLIIYYCIQFFLFFIVSKFMGSSIIEISEFTRVVMLSLVFNILNSYVLVLISNTISLFSNIVYGYSISIILLCLNMILFNTLFNLKLYKYINFLPLSQNLITLKKTSFINSGIFNNFINGYSFNTSIYIMIGIIISLYYISIKIIKKNEIF